MATGDRGFGVGDGLLYHARRGGRIGRRRQAHIDPDLGVVGHDIGTVATLDLSKRDGRWPQLIMHGQRRERMAQRADGLGHGGDGIRALPGLACMRRNACHFDLEPRATLVRHLNLPVGGLGVQHPFVRADPASIDGRLGAAHKVLLVDRADERKAAAGQRAIRRNTLECVDKRSNGASQAALHVAGAAAIEFVVAHNRPKRCDVCVPAIAQGNGIHMADVDESRLVAQSRHGDHKVAAPGEYFELLNLHGIERRTIKLCQLLLNEPLNEVLDLALICAGVRAVNLHKVLRKPPGKVFINHMQPHNQSAFQTDCKPLERSETCA